LKALAPLLVDPKRPKIVHDPKLFQLLAGRVANIRHATQIYSYLLRPTTANHNFADVVMRQFNALMAAGRASVPIICSGSRLRSTRKSRSKARRRIRKNGSAACSCACRY